eukprot:CAMPEP_0115141570 /NCGR_PEP_ID=MMETSP0227-20121206/59620_1 /TAXON_ID=89957 /ORGANISM="Polarella glacialis, Strain CCMP 1383" /LENGTH=44 /DNA_ID= /DNA_START= /DNA_END= /DNA_ORIENTATION=
MVLKPSWKLMARSWRGLARLPAAALADADLHAALGGQPAVVALG